MARVAQELDASAAVLGAVSDELDRRQGMFARAGVETLGRWNEAGPGKALPYVVVAVDECAELSAARVPDREERARAANCGRRVRRMGGGAAAGSGAAARHPARILPGH